MKYSLFFIMLLISSRSIAQNFELLFSTPYLDQQVAFEELEDGGFISLEGIMFIDTLLPLTNNYAYTSLKKYNFEGEAVNSYSFKYNDGVNYFGNFLTILDNGNYLVGGFKENQPVSESKHFLKIISSDLSQEVSTVSINLSNSLIFLNAFVQNNEIACIFSSLDENYKTIVRYDMNGNYLNQFPLNTNFQNPLGVEFYSSFLHNNHIYLPYSNINSLSLKDTTFILRVDLNNNIDTLLNPNFLGFENRTIQLDRKGYLNDNNEYLIAARVKRKDTIITYNVVFKINNLNTAELFFIDSSVYLNMENNNGSLNMGSASENNIYFTTNKGYPFSTDYFYIYNLDKNGNLKWRKSLNINHKDYSYAYFYSIQTSCATKDGGLILTFQADDEYNNHGVYYYKIDSNGNQVDFPTGIFSLDSKLKINDFLLFPNPVQETLHIETSLKGNYQLKVYSVLGEQISLHEISNKSQINLKNLLQGNYLYQIINENGEDIQTGKFLKE